MTAASGRRGSLPALAARGLLVPPPAASPTRGMTPSSGVSARVIAQTFPGTVLPSVLLTEQNIVVL